MVDRITNPSRRHVVRKHVTKTNDTTTSNIDDGGSEPRTPVPCQTIFLLESTANGTKYIDIYKDALNRRRADDGLGECHNTIVVDRDRIVRSVADDRCLEKNGTYQRLHEQAKRCLSEKGRISTELVVQLVRRTIVVALSRLTTCRSGAAANVMLTNFFDLPFIVDFVGTARNDNTVRVDAIVELSCGEIARVRDKFVSEACRAAGRGAEIRKEFWRDFRAALDADERVASVFKDVGVYTCESGYRADLEPPDANRIVRAAREHVLREMDDLQRFVSRARADYETFFAANNGLPTVYPLHINDDDDNGLLYGSYGERLADYPDGAMTVPVILDAMLKAIDGKPADAKEEEQQQPWMDVNFDKLKHELAAAGEGCMTYPVCVPHADECGVTVKKYKLRRTDYSTSAVNAPTVRWKRLLWGSHPLLPPNIVDEHNAIVSEVKSKCGRRDDVDAQLCVLAVNRLRGNLDVFRGERIAGLPASLGTTVVSYKPELLEPLGCRTMVQALERKSERYERTSYAYFEPEDVALVGFYNFRPSRMRSSFRFTVPRQPVHFNDYLGLFHGPGGCKADRFYAMDARRWWWCPTYKEHTERIRFRDDDRLTVSKRKWRFEPGTVCLTYKSPDDDYEIVRHVIIGGENDNDDNDRFRICTGAGDEYCVEIRTDRAGGGSVIEFTGRTAGDGTCTEIVSTIGGSGSSTIRLSRAEGGNRRPHRAVVEIGRRFEDGRVIVEHRVARQTADAVTYWADGKTGKLDSSENRTAGGGTGDRGSTTGSRVTSPTRRRTGSRMLSVSQRSIGSRTSSASRRRTTGYRASALGSGRNLSATTRPEENTPDDDSYQHGTKYSQDGTTRTVTFEDGTTISTRRSTAAGRETSSPSATSVHDPGWTSSVVTGYEYSHPEYRTVTVDRCGTFTVRDLVTRTPDSGLRLRLSGAAVMIEINANGIHVRRDDDLGPEIATFGWKGSEFLFEKNVGATTTTVALDRATATVVVVSAGSKNGSPPPPAEYFVVKRSMSGFGMLDGSWYERFAREMRDRTDAVVREDRNGIVTFFAADGGGTKRKPTRDRRRYGWFQVPFGTKRPGNVTVPELLTFRAFTKLGTDYGPVLDALRSAGTTQGTCGRRPPPTKLVVRANVPRDAATVHAVYTAGSTSRHDPEQDDRIVRTLLNRVVGLSVKCARRRRNDREALEARARMRRNDFIPYFRSDIYGPLKDHLASIGLSYSH